MDNKLKEDHGHEEHYQWIKKGKRLSVSITQVKTLCPSAFVTKGKLSEEDKEENKDLLLVMQYVPPKLRI